jgi:hypothetical protein
MFAKEERGRPSAYRGQPVRVGICGAPSALSVGSWPVGRILDEYDLVQPETPFLDHFDPICKPSTNSLCSVMPREIEPPTIQRDFVLAALAEGKRLDGRSPLQLREITIEFGDELGWCTCMWGKTRSAARRCKVKMELRS